MKNESVSVLKPCVVAIAMSFVGSAYALDFEVGDGWKGNWSSSLSLGTSWRAQGQDSALYGQGNGAVRGRTNGTGNNTTDEGNLNYNKGDHFSTQLKFLTEVELKKGTMGAFVRGKAWHDYAQENENVRLGSQNNGFRSDRPLSDSGFDRLNKFSGTYLLDAYVYDTFQVADNPLQMRVGRQVVNWGESLFIQGVNQINPLDVPSFRKPGAQVKEVFLPVPIVHANQGLGDLGSLEFFYQWRWKNTPIEAGCGNYWGVVGGSIGLSPNGCHSVVSLAGSSAFGYNNGAYITTLDGDKPSDSGQFGMAFRTYLDAIDAEMGVYAMKIHSRTPVVSLQFGDYTSSGSGVPFAAKWEYPEDIRVYGISLAANVAGWSVAGEVSHSRGVPAQIDGNDMILSGLGAAGALPFAPGVSMPFGPYGNGAFNAFNGNGYLPGYERTNKTQLQLNGIKVGKGILGAHQYQFIGELGFQWNDLGSSLRHNRAFIFGPGAHAAYGGACAGNISKEGCRNDGYTTDFAWGYRAKLELTYNNIFNSGVAFHPSVFWSHDVEGWSVDNQFAEGRMAIALGARFSYAKKYSFELSAVRYNRGADYDPLRDRGFYSATLSMNF